jgi:hypothetical protein
MALGLGDGAEIRTPMALTVIFGLTSSTLLTLIVIPLIYHSVDSLRERLLGPQPADQPLPQPATDTATQGAGTGNPQPSSA